MNEPQPQEPQQLFRYCLEQDHYDFFADSPVAPAAPNDAHILVVRLERVTVDEGEATPTPIQPSDLDLLPILFQRACAAAERFPEAFAAVQDALASVRQEFRGFRLLPA